MSPAEQYAAVSFWNFSASQMSDILENPDQNLQLSTSEQLDATMIGQGNYTEYSNLEPISCDNDNMPSSAIINTSQVTPAIKQTPSDLIRQNDLTDREIYGNIFSLRNSNGVDKITPEAFVDLTTDNSAVEDLNEEIFRSNVEQLHSDAVAGNYSVEGTSNMNITVTINNRILDSETTASGISYNHYNNNISNTPSRYSNYRSSAQAITLNSGSFSSNRNELSTQNELPLQQIQLLSNANQTCRSNNRNQLTYRGDSELVLADDDGLDHPRAIQSQTKNTHVVENEDEPLMLAIKSEIISNIEGDNNGIVSDSNTCEVCGKSGFSTKGNLKRHLRAHSGEKPFKCDYCDSRFTEKKSLKIHLRRHTGEKPYNCSLCSKTFSQSGVLQSHMDLHKNQRKFECEKCGKAFRQRSQLKLHLMRHEGVKRLACSTCKAKFLTKGDLARHFRIHTGARPYCCTVCNKTFTRQQSLNEHMNRHSGRKPYDCKYCDKTFSEMSACYKHAKTHKRQESQNQHQPLSVLPV